MPSANKGEEKGEYDIENKLGAEEKVYIAIVVYMSHICYCFLCMAHMPGTVFLLIHVNTLLCTRNIPGIYASTYSKHRK